MKISNSKKQLAKIIHENDGWRDGAEFSAQDKDGEVFHYATKPSIDKGSEVWGHKGCIGYGEFPAKTLPNWHQTILSRDEYSHLYPAPDADGWIQHDGKHEPAIAESGLTLWCKWSDGLEQSHEASMIDWLDDSEIRIIAYRLNKPEAGIETLGLEPTIEQLAADYHNLKDYADRKQQEADAAKADAEAKLAELVAAGRALGLVLSVAEPEPAPELVIIDWWDLRVGDEVECVRSNCFYSKYRGQVGVVERVDFDDESTPVLVRFSFNGEAIWCHEVSFLRRPAKGDADA